MKHIKTMLKQVAHEIGFVAVGVTAAGPAAHHQLYTDWLNAGCHGTMRYLERHASLRADPCLWVPGVRSIIVVALRYPVNPVPQAGGFSALVWGRDYHLEMRDRLERLGLWMRNHAGTGICRYACDAAPLAEREWAARAGLGWIGKQGQLVHPEHGCCLVLGALLTDAVLESDRAQANRCGDCRLCLDACPTGALDGVGRMDARRCLAYLTVEYPGELPDLPQSSGRNTLFGCDRCTAVCPWNQMAGNASVPESLQGNPDSLPDAAACCRMTGPAFEVRFKQTGMERAGLERLRRNARWGLELEGAVRS